MQSLQKRQRHRLSLQSLVSRLSELNFTSEDTKDTTIYTYTRLIHKVNKLSYASLYLVLFFCFLPRLIIIIIAGSKLIGQIGSWVCNFTLHFL